MIGGDQPAGARHVFDDAGRISRQVAADVARDHSGVKIEGAAGRITDDDGERFVLVEILRLRERLGADDQNDCRKRKQK
jgi:hypothetical protein